MTKKAMIQRLLIGLIKSGALNVGDKLPSLREMADDEGVSISTALEAYNDLVAHGVVESRPRNGYFIMSSDDKILDEAMRKLSVEPFPQKRRLVAGEEEEIYVKAMERARRPCSNNSYQLATDSINEVFFDNITMSKYLIKVLKNFPYGTSEKNIGNSNDALAQEISKWVVPTGCIFQRQLIVTTDSISEALMLALRACVKPNGIVGIESPSDRATFHAVRFLNIEFFELESDPVSGISIEALSKHIASGVEFSCIVLSAYNSNPTGAIIPDKNKSEIVKLCKKNSIAIIENDVNGWLSFNNKIHYPLKSLDHENIIYVSSFENVFGDAYSVSWIEGGKFSDKLIYLKGFSGISAAQSIQSCIVEYMQSENINTHLARILVNIQNNVELFHQAVIKNIPGCVIVLEPRGGPYLWFELPEGCNAEEFANLADEHNVFVSLGMLYSFSCYAKRCFRVNCCAIKNTNELLKAAEALGSLLTTYLERKAHMGIK